MRTKLKERHLPHYSCGEEIFHMVSHIVGGGMAAAALTLTVIRAALHHDVFGVIGCAIYGAMMVLLYTMSSIYHGLRSPLAKKVFQILDHCSIFLMIAGCYTPVALCTLREVNAPIGWVVFGLEWALAALAISLNGVDLNSFSRFSMICYIGMGWGILAFFPFLVMGMKMPGILMLLAGGLLYTVGAVCFIFGINRKYFHAIFHVFVLLGSIPHFFTIFFYVV